MNKKKRILLLILLLAAASGGGYWWWQGHGTQPDLSRLALYGNVDIREVQLAFNGSEHIAELLVQEGDRVKAGQVLGRLHQELLQAELAAAEARAAAQEQVLARLTVGSRPEEIARAKAQMEAARAKERASRLTYDRQKKLGTKDLASPEDVDDARAQAEAAAGDAQAAEQTYRLAVEGPRKEDIAEARALLEERRAELALARQHLADATLYAPADGIIRDRILEPGDMATPQTPVLTLALTNPIWVRAYVPEPMLGRVAPGMRALVSTDSYPGKTYTGWIGFISPTSEFTPKNVETPELRTRLVYQVRVYVCNPEDELRLGMPATVSIPLDQPRPQPGQSASPCGEQ